MSRASVLVLALSIWASGALAAPDDARRRASASFKEAQAAFERRDFAAAAAAFEQAAFYDPHPSPLIDAAEAWERNGDHARAAEDCDKVLAMPDVPESFRADAERRLAKLLPLVATLELRGPRTLQARIDSGAPVSLPTKRRVAPGRHLVALIDLATDEARAQDVDVAAGTEKTLDFTPPRPAARPPVPVPSPARPAERASISSAVWASLGVAAVGAAVTTAYGLVTVRDRDVYLETPTVETRSAFYRDRLITNVALGATAAAVVAAVLLWRLSPRGPTIAARAGGVAGTFP